VRNIRWTLVSVALLLCCSAIMEKEGDQDGECNDALDNDGDELYDCDDPDCADYYECLPDPDPDPDTGSDPGPYDYERFRDDMVQASCDKMEECDFFTEYFTYADCLALSDAQDTGYSSWDCSNYDSRAAQECVEAWENVSCDDFVTGTGLDVCDDVCSND